MTTNDQSKPGLCRTVALAASLLLTPLFFAGNVVAETEEIQSEWISPQVGASESIVGARIRSIEELPDAAGQRVVIEIPRQSLDYTDDIPEIIVTAQRPDQTESRLTIEHEWLEDYQNDNYGLVLYLGQNRNLPLRIYFKHDRR